MIQYNCQKCGGTLESPSSMAGQEDQCPLCGQVCTVPQKPAGHTPLVAIICGGAVLVVVAALAIALWPREVQPSKPAPTFQAQEQLAQAPSAGSPEPKAPAQSATGTPVATKPRSPAPSRGSEPVPGTAETAGEQGISVSVPSWEENPVAYEVAKTKKMDERVMTPHGPAHKTGTSTTTTPYMVYRGAATITNKAARPRTLSLSIDKASKRALQHLPAPKPLSLSAPKGGWGYWGVTPKEIVVPAGKTAKVKVLLGAWKFWFDHATSERRSRLDKLRAACKVVVIPRDEANKLKPTPPASSPAPAKAGSKSSPVVAPKGNGKVVIRLVNETSAALNVHLTRGTWSIRKKILSGKTIELRLPPGKCRGSISYWDGSKLVGMAMSCMITKSELWRVTIQQYGTSPFTMRIDKSPLQEQEK